MSNILPKCFVLNCYSKLVRPKEESNLLVCDGEDISSLQSRFEAERSQCCPEYVHIRSCYNNKYWAVDDNDRIYAGEKNPVEEITAPNCTLFYVKRDENEEDYYSADDDTWEGRVTIAAISLDDLEGRNKVYLGDKSTLIVKTSFTRADDTPDDDDTKPTALKLRPINWDDVVILPKHVAFKGDNGKYLQVIENDYMQFQADHRKYNSANFEIFPTTDRRIRVKNIGNGNFWRAGPNWIYSDSSKAPTKLDQSTFFRPARVGENVIALRNIENQYFCRRTTWDYHDDCLCADNAGVTISNEARLVLEEAILTRNIYDIKFREDDCRIYNEAIITMANLCVSNDTELEQEVALDLSYEDTTTHTWTNSVSTTTNVKMGFTLRIPKIAGLTLIYDKSTADEKNYQWGEKRESTKTITISDPIPVKPGGKSQVTVLAKRRYCDVPFSYKQQDQVDQGNNLPPESKDDGVYTGISSTYFKCEYKEV